MFSSPKTLLFKNKAEQQPFQRKRFYPENNLCSFFGGNFKGPKLALCWSLAERCTHVGMSAYGAPGVAGLASDGLSAAASACSYLPYGWGIICDTLGTILSP